MKNIHHLVDAVKNLNSGSLKSASSDPTKLPDPDEKGVVTKSESEGTEEVKPPAASSKPGTDEKSVTPGVPDKEIEDNGGEDSPVKLAGSEAVKKAQSLRMKLAADLGTEAQKKAADDKCKSEEKSEDAPKEKSEGEDKKASAQIHPSDLRSQMVGHLLKSASGRSLLDAALSEVIGDAEASDLLKKAAELGEAEEVDAINRRYAQAEAYKEAKALEDVYFELTKEATDGDFAKIEETAEFLKLASAPFEDNELAAEFFQHGLKIAAAMMQPGMEDPAAMQGAMDQAMPPAAEGEPSIEEILAVLEELVAEGRLQPEEAEQLAMALVAEMEGGMKQASENPIFARLAIVNDIAEGKYDTASA